LTDKSQWHPEALVAVLLLMSVLFAVAGLANFLGIIDVELWFFEYFVKSPLGNIVWIAISLLFAVLFAYLFRRLWLSRRSAEGPAT
jgi:hypothetical protein